MQTILAIARWPGITLLALAIAGVPKSSHADDQQTQATIAALERLGAEVETDTTPDGLIRVTGVAFSFIATAPKNAALVRLESLKDLASFRISVKEFNDEGLSHLKELKQLKLLAVGFCRIGDAGLAHPRGLDNLQTLSLSDTRVGDAGLAHLKNASGLISLTLSQTAVTDAGLVQLKNLTKLQELHLENTKVTAAGVSDLKKTRPKLKVVR